MPAQMLLTLLALTLATGPVGGETGYPYPISKPGCDDRCGNMSIPYPFGKTESCSLGPDFFINCAENGTAFQGKDSDVRITEIMLVPGEIRAWLCVAHLCNYDGSMALSDNFTFDGGATFTLSHTKNKFTVVGCDATGYVDNLDGKKFKTGCSTGCEKLQDVVNGTCEGIGCCQILVPRRIKALNITVKSYNTHDNSTTTSFNPCNTAFVVEQAAYNFSSLDFMKPSSPERPRKPAIFDWVIGTANCSFEKNQPWYVCGENSVCADYDVGPGYRCNCFDGYQGNPYLPNGCQDIDECLSKPCIEQCKNLPGKFQCLPCRKGYIGDGYKNGTGCVPISYTERILSISLGTSLSFIAILFICGGLRWILQKRKLKQLKDKYYKENGGLTLQHLLSQHERQLKSFKIYTANELKKATHSYDESKILGKGGQGTVYKGELVDNTIVAIKKSNAMDKSEVDSFVNEIIILSQTNHRNVVKLLGCCLETEIPMLVYEFIPYGTFSDYIRKDTTPQMSWHNRVRIAAETAEGISYLHSSAGNPIIHRDIKTANILLDVGYTAKVADFGISKFAPIDKTSSTASVAGTPGYMDPEYFTSGVLSEKSDVYSFGVVLLELLTGSKPIDNEKREAERGLASYFKACMKEGRLDDIVDENLKRDVKGTQLEEVASIAARCLNEKREDRPSMKEVTRVLERVAKRETDHPWVTIDLNDEQETGLLLHGPMRSNSSSDLNDEQETGVLLTGPVRSTSTSNATTLY